MDMLIKVRDKYLFGNSGFLVKMHDHRHGNTSLMFYDNDEVYRGAFLIKGERRAMTEKERTENPEVFCVEVVRWTLLSQSFSNGNPAINIKWRDEDPDELIKQFLKEYQWAGGRGCFVDGEWHVSLVEIVRGGILQ